MATTVRVIRPISVGVGPFGRRVAATLEARFAGSVPPGDFHLGPDVDLAAAFDQRPDAVVLALWRPAPALCEAADQFAHQTRIPWLPVVVEHPYLTVGPWVAPGAGPCYRCFHARRVQHDADWATTAAVHETYDRCPDVGPAGFLPQHARLAAGVVASYLGHGLGDPSGTAGQFTTMSLGSPAPASHGVVACHDCDRCGTPYRPRDPRHLLRLDAKEPVNAR